MNKSRNNRNHNSRALALWLTLALCLALLLCGASALGEIGNITGGNDPVCETHTWNEGTVDKPASCKETGLKKYTCTVCGATGTETIEKTAHTPGEAQRENEVPATCTTQGSYDEVVRCTECGTVLTSTPHTIDIIAHTPGEEQKENVTEPTCTTDGKHDNVIYCTECKQEITRESNVVDPALNHDWGEWGNSTATCTEAGKETRACKREGCGETEERDVSALGHNLTKTDEVPATCEQAGTKAYWTCSRCNKLFSDAEGTTEITEPETIAKLEHVTEIRNAKEATCGEPGYTGDEVCTLCNQTITAGTEIKATGNHTWDAGVETTPATITAEGVMTYTCTVCKQTKTEPIAKLTAYKVTFVDEDGTTILKEATEYEAGTAADKIALPENPTKKPDADNTYTFDKWVNAADATKGIEAVTADVTYKATYKAESLTREAAPYTYKLNPEKTEATILSYSGSDANLIVPDTFESGAAKVVAIAPDAFKGNKTLVSLVIPATVKTIGDNAFAECPELTSLTLPDALRPLDGQASPLNIIDKCDKLTTLVLRCTGNTTLTGGTTITHNDKEGDAVPAAATLPMAVTDIIVTKNNVQENPASLSLGDFTVAEGHSVSVEAGATLTNTGTLTNFGTVSNGGTFTNNGTVNSCTGTLSGVSGGTVRANGQHDYKDGKCTICGAELPKLKIKYNGSAVSKVYDKTRNVKLSKSSFAIEDTHGLDLNISKISASYDKADAGKRTVKVTLTLGGNDADLYGKKATTSLSATIEPKPLIITPTAGQKKTYGAANPKNYTGKVKGLLSGDKITGKLARETGEDAGKYRILQGTIDAGTNYDVQVLEEYFTIEPKSINTSDVGLVTIGNQRYTGQKVEPAITLRYGKNVLKKDVDFKAEYKDNIQPGTATVKLTGIGNYTGSRESSFRILNIASGVSASTSSSGGGYSYSGFDDGEGESGEDYEDETSEGDSFDSDEGKLVLGEQDYGTVLFDAEGNPSSFVLYDNTPDTEDGSQAVRQLTIIADPLTDNETGETMLLDDGEREQYDELHLRLTMPLVDTLTGLGYSNIIYTVENAEVTIPLASLAAEIPLEDEEETAVVGTVEGETGDLGDGEAVDAPVDELEVELGSDVLEVAAYDICVEQSEAAVLSEREQNALMMYKPLTPAYRVRVRAVTEGEEGAALENASGETVALPEAQPLPQSGWPMGLVLHLQPLEDLSGDGEGDTAQVPGATALFVSAMENPGDLDQILADPANFVDVDGMTYAEVPMHGDGLYGVGTPSDGTDGGFDEGEELEDLDGTGPTGLSTMGGSFTLDENGNPVVND